MASLHAFQKIASHPVGVWSYSQCGYSTQPFLQVEDELSSPVVVFRFFQELPGSGRQFKKKKSVLRALNLVLYEIKWVIYMFSLLKSSVILEKRNSFASILVLSAYD